MKLHDYTILVVEDEKLFLPLANTSDLFEPPKAFKLPGEKSWI
jgi:hypothetical protein